MPSADISRQQNTFIAEQVCRHFCENMNILKGTKI